jgi:hypothetical protein
MGLKARQPTSKPARSRKRRKRRFTFATLWDMVREGWRVFRAVVRAIRGTPPFIRVFTAATLLFVTGLGFNWAYQTFHKPTEILFPLDRSLNKSPVQTWKHYEPLFREHATAVITPEFLGALAQVEGGGNPVARTYWRWQWSNNPLEWYRPASSAVGMYQITDGTFQEAKRYCIHDHEVVEDGPWHDLESCWFNSLYTRIFPSHAIEMTAARLDREVARIIGAQPSGKITLRQKQNLAAVIHLCGAGAGQAYAARNFRLSPRQRCGDHDVTAYLARIHALQTVFAKPAAGDKIFEQGP